MFHMMNEARIGVGLAGDGSDTPATARRSTTPRTRRRAVRSTARTRPTRRCAIIEHADVKRMLLAQKSYVEGALALGCTARGWSTSRHTARPAPTATRATAAGSADADRQELAGEWCLEANSLAIQVHGGYGYTRDFASSSTGATTA